MSILFLFFFPDFVTIFVLITIFGNGHRPCKHYSNIVHNNLHHVYSFFLFFLSDFLVIFALLTIFGNVHRPCKQYPNIVNNSLHHVCSFITFFSLICPMSMAIQSTKSISSYIRKSPRSPASKSPNADSNGGEMTK